MSSVQKDKRCDGWNCQDCGGFCEREVNLKSGVYRVSMPATCPHKSACETEILATFTAERRHANATVTVN